MSPSTRILRHPAATGRAVLLSAWLVQACSTGSSSLGTGPLEPPEPATGVGGSAGESGVGGGLGGGANGNGTASCQGLVTDEQRYPMTTLVKPRRFAAVTDPEFGTRIVRATDVATETGSDGIVPMYSTIPAWNADESYLLLLDLDLGHRLYDGHNYEFVRNLAIRPADVEQVYWHPRDPDLLYYVDGNQLVEYSVSADSAKVVRTFGDCARVSAGDDPMYISWDGNSFGLLCESTGQAFVYRLDTDSETARVPANSLGAQVAPSGDLVFLRGNVYDANMGLLRSLPLGDYGSNASLGQLSNGRDTLNTAVFAAAPAGSGTGSLVVFDLSTGSNRVIIGQDTGYPYPPSGTHLSAIAQRAPGWVALSIVGDQHDGQGVLDNELLLVDTNRDLVCRIGHHRSHGADGPQGYWAAPHVVISPSATRVVFGSDWGGGAMVDTYVVELPSYQR